MPFSSNVDIKIGKIFFEKKSDHAPLKSENRIFDQNCDHACVLNDKKNLSANAFVLLTKNLIDLPNKDKQRYIDSCSNF